MTKKKSNYDPNYALKAKINNVLESYSNDFLFDFSSEDNRTKIMNELVNEISELASYKIGVWYVRKKSWRGGLKKNKKKFDIA